MGVSMHRMGPSFKRANFGFPILGLGLLFPLIPSLEFPAPESEIIDSLVSSFPWLFCATVGTMMILRGSPNYGDSNSLVITFGWISIGASCILAIPILSELDSSQAIEGISAIFGFAVGILPFIAGILLSERGSSIDGESAPLSEEEEKLVQTILVRRIGGE